MPRKSAGAKPKKVEFDPVATADLLRELIHIVKELEKRVVALEQKNSQAQF